MEVYYIMDKNEKVVNDINVVSSFWSKIKTNAYFKWLIDTTSREQILSV